MNKKLAQQLSQLVLAVQSAKTQDGIGDYNYAMEAVVMSILEHWPVTGEMNDLVTTWRLNCDSTSAIALASWLLEQ